MGQLRISMNLGAAFTPLRAEGYALPAITARVDDPNISYILDIAVSVVHGQPVCARLTAEQKDGGPPVTRRGLNSLFLSIRSSGPSRPKPPSGPNTGRA